MPVRGTEENQRESDKIVRESKATQKKIDDREVAQKSKEGRR